MSDETQAAALSDGLRRWANGSYPDEAAVELLIRTGWARRGDFFGDVIGEPDNHGCYSVDWDAVGASLRGERPAPWLAASGGELKVLRIAYSLAGNGLANNVPGLDREYADLVLAAISHANGSHEGGRIVEDPEGNMVDDATGLRYSMKQMGPLHPWPEDES